MNNMDNNSQKTDMQKVDEIIKRNKKVSRILSLSGVILGSIGMVYLVLNQIEDTKIKNTLNVQEVIIDSLSISKKLDVKKQKQIDSLNNFTNDFLSKINSTQNFSHYYDTLVTTFYLKHNLKIEQVREEITLHRKKYPRAKLIFNKNDIHVSVKNESFCEIYINTRYYPDSILSKSEDLLFQIRLNSNNKIFYIRNLIPKK